MADKGFDGLIIQLKDRRLIFKPNGRVFAGAGIVWDELVAEAVNRNLAGLECLSGIPGWVGAAPIQNIGAYGQELAQTLRSVEAWDRLPKDSASLKVTMRLRLPEQPLQNKVETIATS